MKSFARKGVTLWAGYHRKLGFVVFDPRSQVLVPDDKVRLFVVAEGRMATFIRELVKPGIERSEERVLEQAVDDYLSTRLQRRVTHCYGCKTDLNSIDFTLCSSCHWIRCTCGACGCEYDRASA